MMATTQRPRVLLTDDHDALLQSLRAMLSSRYDVVGVAHDGAELLALLRTTPADCLLLDLAMPGRSGLELLPDLRALAPQLRVLIVTMHADRLLADAALRAGARGYMPKDSGAAELAEAIDAVLDGRTWISPRVPAAEAGDSMALVTGLSPRQVDIARMMAEGRSPADIEAALGVSETALAFHVSRIERALGALV
jgi:two-component system, NarL family, invasion response regulator UvrY